MNKRISQTFSTLADRKGTALIPFVTAGFPKMETTLPLLHSMAENGADIIELGMPFSDPMADGIAIQKASDRALKNGVTLDVILELVGEFRQTNQSTPIVLMGYLNPIENYGRRRFLEKAKQCGVDGLLIVDLLFEPGEEFSLLCREHNIDQIKLIAPNTPPDRRKKIIDSSSGFLYYVSLKGTTGSASLDTQAVNQTIRSIKSETSLPVVAGFGIQSVEDVQRIKDEAAGVVIGSKIVSLLSEHKETPKAIKAVSDFLSTIRKILC